MAASNDCATCCDWLPGLPGHTGQHNLALQFPRSLQDGTFGSTGCQDHCGQRVALAEDGS